MPAQGQDAAAGHGEVGAEVGGSVQRVLNAAQKVVGLEDEDQLSGHSVQELSDLRQIVRNVLLNVFHLQ